MSPVTPVAMPAGSPLTSILTAKRAILAGTNITINFRRIHDLIVSNPNDQVSKQCRFFAELIWTKPDDHASIFVAMVLEMPN